MTPAVPLTQETLERFRAGLQLAGAPLGAELEPARSDEQIAELARQLGVTPPPELVTLWKWAAAPTVPRTPDSWDANPEFELWPPERAVKETLNHRLDPTVSKSTIAFAGPSGQGYLLVDGGNDSPTSPVTYAFIEDPDTLTAAPSLGALFQLWADVLGDEGYRYLGDRWDPFDGPQTILIEE